jgi:transposase
MARGYLPVDRDQPFLLPPDVRDWLAEDHLAWFVIDVVGQVDTSRLHARHRLGGAGRRAYHPEMLLALLLYAYCTGQRSSRQIERLCEVDVAYRVICANHVPDHTTIARFRQAFAADVTVLFADVLELCAAAGLGSLGVVAIDGTKLAADAAMRANRTREQVEAEIATILAEAERVDADEDEQFGDGRGDELPDELADRHSRLARLREAKARLDRERDEYRAERQRMHDEFRRRPRSGPTPKDLDAVAEAQRILDAELADLARRIAAYEAKCAANGGRRPRGKPPSGNGGRRVKRARERFERARARATAGPAEPSASKRRRRRDGEERPVNLTDVDSRIMPTAGGGWVQGYNAQAAVSEDGLVIAADVTTDIRDSGSCEAMTDAVHANTAAAGFPDPVGTMLFDAGYWSNDNGANVTELPDGCPSRLIATAKAFKLRHKLRAQGPATGPPPPEASPAEAMEHRLRTVEGETLYRKRQHTVEPVFGQIKHDRGIRRFNLRGLGAVKAEWQLITASHNVSKLHRAAT